MAAFRKLGYNTEVLGFERIHNTTKHIRRAAKSPEGLCECTRGGVRLPRSGYYNWMSSQRARERREKQDRTAFAQILEAYQFRGYAKGVRSIQMRLLHMGIRMNVKKIRRLMRKYNLSCPIRKPNPYRRLRKSIRMGTAAENLVNQEFESRGPRAVLLTDITYIPLNGAFC